MDQCLRGCLRSRYIQSLQKQEMSIAIQVGKVRDARERLVGRLTPVTHIGRGFTRLGFCVDDFCALHRSIITHRSAAVSNRYADQVSTTWTRRCSKNFSITESLRFLFRAEAFNTPNTPPFAQPTQLNFTTLTDFSAITSTRSSNQNFGARTLQLALKMFY
jgi:hypothetical protein